MSAGMNFPTYEEQLQYQIELLKRELVKKEAEVLRLKTERMEKGRCPKKMIREMYAEIQKQTDKHSVSELCEIYGVSRSGYLQVAEASRTVKPV